MSYALVVVLDGIIVALYFILNPIAKRRRAREAEKQRPGDEAGIEGGLNAPVSRSPTLIAHGFTVEKQNTR